MKQKDYMLILVVVFFGGIISFFASKLIFSSPQSRQTEVEIVEEISADFQLPDNKYFNSESINPTKLIQIGDNNNSAPFNQPQQ